MMRHTCYVVHDFQMCADLFRSEQVPICEMLAVFENNALFAWWYNQKYVKQTMPGKWLEQWGGGHAN